MLDANPLCEAASPSCAPATQWKVMARVLR